MSVKSSTELMLYFVKTPTLNKTFILILYTLYILIQLAEHKKKDHMTLKIMVLGLGLGTGTQMWQG